MFDFKTKPRTSQGAYPERKEPRLSWLDRAGNRVAGPFVHWRQVRSLGGARFVEKVASFGEWAASLDQQQVLNAAAELGYDLRKNGFTDALVAKSFALIREVAGRTLGQRHFDVQLIGARVMLNGMVAEMETGEGKTLTATLAAATVALAGIPVHIITVNDYLASRDAEWMGAVYVSLGLTVGTIIHGMDPPARRQAYGCNVTYCTNKEVAFDYLKDRITLGHEASRVQLQLERLYEERPRLNQLLLRGLYYGIVDEADSVLVDEARTPLIISGARGDDSAERDTYQTGLSLASEMILDRDFEIEDRDRVIKILPQGLERLADATESMGGVWARAHWREELVRQALSAIHLFTNGKQYLVDDGKVQIIDEYTGRVMPDRSWEHGLHQMIEVKENCPTTKRIDPLARISYQRFFRRYLWLAGMTGTAREVTSELWSVYNLPMVSIPTNRPGKRERWPDQIYVTQDEKWTAIVHRIEELHEHGRPVLVGTRSVKASEHLSHLLNARRLPHRLLNARQNADEAMIIAEAGNKARITVATNMAGRGTDIRLEAGVAELGGLHVIATELHEARRVDRQLFGRCGRQGDAGSCEAIISLEDELVQVYSSGAWKKLGAIVSRRGRGSSSWARTLNLKMAQRSAERLHLRMRKDLLKMDEHLETALAFSGRSE